MLPCKNKTATLLVLVALASLTGCSAPEPKTETVVMAKNDIPLAHVIMPQDLEEKQLDTSKVPKDAVHRSDLVAGRYSRGIKSGLIFTTRYIVPAGGLLNEAIPSVVYATAAIPAGCYISPDAIEEKPMEIEKIPSSIYECNKKTFANTYARKDIRKGDMLSFDSFIQESGRHYIFARNNLKAGELLRRADIEIKDPPSLNPADTLSVETLLKTSPKKDIRRGKHLTIDDLN